MPADTLTFEMSGDVSLTQFTTTMKRFQALIAELSKTMSEGGKVDWRVEDLNSGSAIATIQGFCEQPENTERIIRAYGDIGVALSQGLPLPYSDRVKRRATELAQSVGGTITALRFETPFVDAIVGRQSDVQIAIPSITYAYGAIKGRVETLTSRRGLRFTLYDAIFDRPVSCYLSDGQEDNMRGAWERRVIVSGLIGREPASKRPIVVRDIRSIEILIDSEPGGYRDARGVLGSPADSARSEVIIRSMRDAD